MLGGRRSVGSFWSDAKIVRRNEREAIVVDEDGVNAFDENRLDGAGYRLRLGRQAYISPASEDARASVTDLEPGKAFIIPPGQFAFLLTEEVVRVPGDAIAFISLRSKTAKFRGLVNVSGFHADPAYDGKLIFSVFNAGPGDVHLARGEELFTIMFADLDQTSDRPRKGKGYMRIPSELIYPIAGKIQSLAGLKTSIDDVEDRIEDRLRKLERDVALARWAAALGLGVLVTLLTKAFSGG